MTQPKRLLQLSVVIPSFNSGIWLPSTLESIAAAVEGTDIVAEVILIDDGSTDDTVAIVEALQPKYPIPLRLISQANAGVFQARIVGAQQAKFEQLLFVDSRVLIERSSIEYLLAQVNASEIPVTRIGHVATAAKVPLVGFFWEVPTHVFWGGYLKKPRLTRLTATNFDSVPKGTGFLFIEKTIFMNACEALTVRDKRFVSDDTKLLRYIAEKWPVFLDPDFRAIYRPRVSVPKFLAHALMRGTLFVDSYFGTSVIRSGILVAIAILVPVFVFTFVLVVFAQAWLIALLFLAAWVILISIFLLIAVVNGARCQALSSFAVFSAPFTMFFWAGVVRGLIIRVRRALQ